VEPEGSLPQSQVPATCPYLEPAQSSPYPHIPLLQELQSSATRNIGLYLRHRKKCKGRYGWQHPGLPFLWLLCRYPPAPLAYANKPKARSATEFENHWHTFTRREGVKKTGGGGGGGDFQTTFISNFETNSQTLQISIGRSEKDPYALTVT
jgi:hypothetical protein